MNLIFICLFLWVGVGIINSVRCVYKEKCQWLDYWLLYICWITVLIEKIVTNWGA